MSDKLKNKVIKDGDDGIIEPSVRRVKRTVKTPKKTKKEKSKEA